MSLSVETYALCKKYTNKAITEATAELKWKTVIVEELPETGAPQTIYFVPYTSGGDDYYKEYIWIDQTEEFEEMGSTQVIVYDDELSDESENAVQNKVVKAALDAKIADTFKTITVGNVDLVAEGADSMEYVAGDNVELTADAQTNEITISSSDTQYTGDETSVGSASNWSAGTLPTLGADIQADKVSTWNAGTTPSFTIQEGHILAFDEGTVPSLTYATQTIPNVTGVGTLPSLTITNKTVLEGISEVAPVTDIYIYKDGVITTGYSLNGSGGWSNDLANQAYAFNYSATAGGTTQIRPTLSFGFNDNEFTTLKVKGFYRAYTDDGSGHESTTGAEYVTVTMAIGWNGTQSITIPNIIVDNQEHEFELSYDVTGMQGGAFVTNGTIATTASFTNANATIYLGFTDIYAR